MNRALELELIDEARARIATKRTDVGEAPAALRAADYTSPERLARERATLFRTQPLCVGFSSQVARPGEFLTHAETEVPILVARGADGVLRAFVNACRHRGTLLEDAPCGAGKKAFVCPYHAWSYDLGGALLGRPHGEVGFPQLDRAQHGLRELACGERAGLVWVVPDAGAPGLALDTALGPLGAELHAQGFGEHVLFAPSRRVRKLNWKLMMDSSYESYHFRVVHAKTIYPLFHDNTGVFAWADPHCRLVLPKRSITKLDERARDTWRLRDHANVIYGFFPNTIALVQPDHAMVISAWPIDVDTTAITAGMLIPEAPATESAERHWRRNEQIFWDAIEEDIAITEKIQRTLRAVPGERLPLGAFEHLLARYHAAIERALG